MSNQRVRVLVVEDSFTIRKWIVEILASQPGMDVVGEAADGKSAIELCQELRPDVVTMDMMLPVMTGVSATEYIMAYCPTPILIVSASTNRNELFKTYDALAAGAVDVLEKPLGVETDKAWEQRLVAAVQMVARIRVITHPRARLAHLGHGTSFQASSPLEDMEEPRVVAIGASTGGPSALLTVLGALPKNFPLPILVVLHISETFAIAMAQWLDAQIDLNVRYARDGERLPTPGNGCVLMAPSEVHLEVANNRLLLSNNPERHSCRPSVDVLFESLAAEMGSQTIGCLLTGMGKDGARGLFEIKDRGGLTFAQDEHSSVVFGMPGEAIRLGAACAVLPLDEIGHALVAAAHCKTTQRLLS
ncbi:MAG: chemotaxis-specific protein-glutamate methyltransferase CheB [Myxococcota bacterium]